MWKKKFEKPNYLSQKDISFLCQCKNGHIFDYRKRIKFPVGTVGFAPCQGKCPECGAIEFTFIGTGVNVYPIKHNYLG